MHARELLELGALVAVRGHALIHTPIPTSAVRQAAQYWTASRCRLDRWMRGLRHYLPAATPGELEAARNGSRLRPLLEEVLTSELLTRTWAATAAACDRAWGQSELESLARNILVSHQEARNRALHIMIHAQAFDHAESARLNRLRRSLERWCDMLLAHLAPIVDIGDFAFDADRAGDFAEDLTCDRSPAATELACQLVIKSLRASVHGGLADRSPNSDLNQKIGSSILCLLPDAAAFASGWPTSLWLQRLTHAANDAQNLVDELFTLDNLAAS